MKQNTPVSSAPTRPPTPWTPKASSESSYAEALLHLHRAVADGRADGAEGEGRRRDHVAGGRRDGHQAGQDARARPRLVGRRWCHHSISSHVSAPAAAAVCVVAKARPAM